MTALPTKTLGEVFELRYGKNLPSGSRRPGKVDVFGSNGVVGTHDEAFTNGPTIVIGRKGSIGSVHLSAESCWPIDTTYFIDSFENQDPAFWAYQLRTLNLAALNRATAIPGISREDAYQLRVVVPELDVQRRIVAKLDALLAKTRAAREQLEAVPALVEQYRQSVLAAAFRGDLTADWRKQHPDVEPASKLLERIRLERRAKWEAAELAKLTSKGKAPKDDKWKSKYVEPEPVDTSDLPELPPTWCWASVESLTTHIVDCLHRTPEYSAAGFPAIRTADVVRGRLLLDQAKRVSAETYREQVARLEPLAGDVLYTREGERFGLAAVVPDGVALCMAQRMMQFRVAQPTVPEFFMWALNSPHGYAQAVADVGGSTSPHVNIGSIRRFALPVCSVEEQRRIAEQIRRYMDAVRDVSSYAAEVELDLVERSMLAKAFRGELVD